MAETGMQIGWGTGNSADIVAAARQSLQQRLAPRKVVSAAADPYPAKAELPRVRPAFSTERPSRAAIAGKPGVYAAAVFAFTIAGVAGVWSANASFAPEMYDSDGLAPIAEAFARNENYAVFDLNLNIRVLREAHVAKFSETPDLVILGASHWQEGHAGLVKGKRFYNAHVHRDYWQDMLGMAEIFARNKRLPKQMIISIRDDLFKPVEKRTDYLWEPGIANYRAMAGRLGLETERFWKTLPYRRIRERLSLPMLFTNVTRWYKAQLRPHATLERHFPTLDTLLPDGSIVWSESHRKSFTRERTEREARSFAELRRNNPPMVDPMGVKAIDRLLSYLKKNGVQVFLAHPPFNPQFYDRIRGTPYERGLHGIEKLTRQLARTHGLEVIGGFDPAKSGCTAEMFIDAEHSNSGCLGKIMAEYQALDASLGLRPVQE